MKIIVNGKVDSITIDFEDDYLIGHDSQEALLTIDGESIDNGTAKINTVNCLYGITLNDSDIKKLEVAINEIAKNRAIFEIRSILKG